MIGAKNTVKIYSSVCINFVFVFGPITHEVAVVLLC